MSEYAPENDFQAHADVLSDYQQLTVDNVTPTSSGQYNAPGTVVYGSFTTPPQIEQGQVYSAIILPVLQHQLPREFGGGFVPSLLCTVSVNKNLLPAGVSFHTGHFMYVNPSWSGQRLCQIHSYADCYTSWLITLVEVSENA